jgi:hypothetical protein
MKTEPATQFPECHEGPEAFKRFDEEMKFLLSVPHTTIARRARAYKKKSLKNPNRPGPKPKINPSV